MLTSLLLSFAEMWKQFVHALKALEIEKEILGCINSHRYDNICFAEKEEILFDKYSHVLFGGKWDEFFDFFNKESAMTSYSLNILLDFSACEKMDI